MTEATREGVEEVQSTPNPRDQALSQIADNVYEKKKEEFESFDEDAAPVELEPEEIEVEAKEVVAAVVPVEKTEKLKIDGQEVDVPESRILEAGKRALQKELAADKRLEEATRLLNEAKQQRAPQEITQPSEDAATLAKAIQFGTEEEAVKAVESLMGRRQAIPDVHAVVRQEMETSQALHKFQEDYKDIVSDPYLLSLASQLEDQRLAKIRQGTELPKPLYEAFKEHGEAIRKWRDGITKPQVNQDKLTRKETIQNLPSAKVKAPSADQPKPESPSDIIEGIRKARHQPT